MTTPTGSVPEAPKVEVVSSPEVTSDDRLWVVLCFLLIVARDGIPRFRRPERGIPSRATSATRLNID